MMENLIELLQRHEAKLQELSEKLQNLDQRLSKLEKPSLMYRRPNASEYEKLSDTLDYLHNNIEGLKQDLTKLARTV